MAKSKFLFADISWGWLLVVVLGLAPIVFMIFGRERRPRRNNQQNNNNSNSSSSSRPNKDKKFLYRAGSKFVLALEAANLAQAQTIALLHDMLHIGTDLYLLFQVTSDVQEDQIRAAVQQLDLFNQGLNPLKLLFCETDIGKNAIARQIEPALFVDTSSEKVVKELARFLPFVALVTSGNSTSALPENMLLAKTWKDLFEDKRNVL